jgi:hypothetical protein
VTEHFVIERSPPADDEDVRMKKLWGAVIRRAVVDWVLYRRSMDVRKRRLYLDADEWLFGGDESEIGSFIVLCNHLDMEPCFVRKIVKSLTSEDLRKLRRSNLFDDR